MPKKPMSAKSKEKFNLQEIRELISLLRRNNIWEFELEQNGVRVHIVTGESNKAKSGVETVLASNLNSALRVNPYSAMVPVMPTPAGQANITAPPPVESAQALNANNTATAVERETSAETELAAGNLVMIKSPMVGTFYRAPSPDKPPYVEVGDFVEENTVLCIIEAMKLMNEIKAECRGKVAKILVENGQPVEYGQHIFLIEPSA